MPPAPPSNGLRVPSAQTQAVGFGQYPTRGDHRYPRWTLVERVVERIGFYLQVVVGLQVDPELGGRPEVPPQRSAVSAVMRRLPCTISSGVKLRRLSQPVSARSLWNGLMILNS